MNTSHSTLLNLPPELRDHIGELAIRDHQDEDGQGNVRINHDNDGERLLPPLTHTSKHIRAEALPLWYHTTRFWADYLEVTEDYQEAVQWFRCIAAGNARYIQRFTFIGFLEWEDAHSCHCVELTTNIYYDSNASCFSMVCTTHDVAVPRWIMKMVDELREGKQIVTEEWVELLRMIHWAANRPGDYRDLY